MGFAPVNNPALVVVVTLNGASRYGGAVAAPVFQAVATAAVPVVAVCLLHWAERPALTSLESASALRDLWAEAFRIQEARFGEGATTTTELLAAETEVAQARVGYAGARHAYFIQLAGLAQATGQLPDSLLRPEVRR